MGTKASTKYVAGDRNSCRCAMPSAAGQLTAVPHHAAANVPLYRELPAPHCHGDKLAVGLHLGPTGWMDWHTPEHGRRRVLVPAGSLSLVPARASVWWQRARPSEFVLVALEPRFVADASGRGEEITWCPMPVFQDPMIAHMISALRAEVRDGCLSGRPYSTSLCTALAIHLVRRYAAAAVPAEPCKGGLAPDRLRHVLDHIEGHLSDALRLTQLAEVARLSSAHFSTQFRRSTGLPPHRYVLQRRVKRAKELLVAGHMSLAEIGSTLGFPSQAHFTTTFRKLVGTTPGAYRDGFSHFGSEIVQGTRNQPADYERPETAFAAILTQGSLRSQWSMPG